MAKKVKERTEDELARAASHTCYELLAMVDATVRLAYNGDPAFLEATLLHARNLIEFFSEYPGSKITAGDFLPDWKPMSGNRFQEATRVLNNWSSHLTWLRVDEEEELPSPTWDPVPLVLDLVGLVETEFADKLPRERTGWFSGSIEVVRENLKRLRDGGSRPHLDASTSDTFTTTIKKT
jgi:hypothetical protein